MKIYCAICRLDQECDKQTGKGIYPHRSDLADLIFWQCPECGGYVGTHKTTGYPLGVIVSKEVKNARREMHKLLDAPWKSGRISRRALYKAVSHDSGYEYHTAQVKTLTEARHVYRTIQAIVARIQ